MWPAPRPALPACPASATAPPPAAWPRMVWNVYRIAIELAEMKTSDPARIRAVVHHGRPGSSCCDVGVPQSRPPYLQATMHAAPRQVRTCTAGEP